MKLLQILAITAVYSILTFCLVVVLISDPQLARADTGSFDPVWKMLTREQKQQFVAGYLNGMRDAAKMTDLLQGLVKQSPDSAASSLDRLAQIYLDVGRSNPEAITDGIETFYSDPDNSGAQLSAAITAAQSRQAAGAIKIPK